MVSTTGKRLSSWLSAFTVPVLVGFVGYGLWMGEDHAPRQAAEDESSSAAVSNRLTEAASDHESIGLPPGVTPGSMQGTLVATGERNRAHILRLAIIGEGYTCAQLIGANAVGQDARVWRARCIGGETYWVSVDRVDRLSVDPAPYGDIDPSVAPPTRVAPEIRPEQTLKLEDKR